jgi:hypothetical protein
VHQEIAVVRQNPLRLSISFHAERKLARVFQPQSHLVGDGLDVARVGARADHEVIGECGDAGQVQNADVGGLLGFGGAHS